MSESNQPSSESIREIANTLRATISPLVVRVEALRDHPEVSGLLFGTREREKVDDRIKEAVTLLENARMSLGKVIQHSEKRESIFDIQKDPEKMGRLAHRRFCEASGMTDEVADWDALSTDAQKGWIAAGSAGAPVAQ